ncbi:unnamed protein product [Amoebophrya sp. A120]|nr:unnamed protein product [Amoebophrya sp. A120]|eukprot:GSA120T00016978001.1
MRLTSTVSSENEPRPHDSHVVADARSATESVARGRGPGTTSPPPRAPAQPPPRRHLNVWVLWFLVTTLLSIGVFAILIFFVADQLEPHDFVFVVFVSCVDLVMMGIMFYKFFFEKGSVKEGALYEQDARDVLPGQAQDHTAASHDLYPGMRSASTVHDDAESPEVDQGNKNSTTAAGAGGSFLEAETAMDMVRRNSDAHKRMNSEQLVQADHTGQQPSGSAEVVTAGEEDHAHDEKPSWREKYLIFCHLLLPLELFYVCVFSSSLALIALAVFLLVGIHAQWFHRSRTKNIPYFRLGDKQDENIMHPSPRSQDQSPDNPSRSTSTKRGPCVMDDFGAAIPACMRGPVFDLTSFFGSITLLGIGAYRILVYAKVV